MSGVRVDVEGGKDLLFDRSPGFFSGRPDDGSLASIARDPRRECESKPAVGSATEGDSVDSEVAIDRERDPAEETGLLFSAACSCKAKVVQGGWIHRFLVSLLLSELSS